MYSRIFMCLLLLPGSWIRDGWTLHKHYLNVLKKSKSIDALREYNNLYTYQVGLKIIYGYVRTYMCSNYKY